MGLEQKTMSTPELPLSPIKIRFHHLSKLIDLASSYKTVSNASSTVPFQTLYLYPEAARQFIQTATAVELNDAKMIYSGNFLGFGKSYILPEYAEDFIGKKGKKTDEFMRATTSAFEEIVLSNPGKRVELSSQPDIICATCQINGKNRPGNHCVLPRSKDINSDTDEIHLRALLDFLSDPNTPDNTKNEFKSSEQNGEAVFTTSIGMLRCEEFMERFKQKVDKIWRLLD